MISVEQARKILRNNAMILDSESVPFEQSLGRILAEPINADRDFPAYHRVAMDGIAIDFDRYANGQRNFRIETTIAAGMPVYILQDSGNCVEIMTGAILTQGCDTVIPYEEIQVENGVARISGPVTQRQNVHHQGSDRLAGDVLVAKGTKLAAPDIGIAATVGMNFVEVYRKPSICLVSTGDELVPVDGTPLPHQIRTSNTYALRAALEGYYGQVAYRHLPDDDVQVRRAIHKFLEEFQVLIFIGGSSMGKYDFLPEALKAAGITEHFYKIRQRPGKPFWFGSRNNQFVFALPGNPVSCFMCLENYFKYWLNNSLGVSKIEDCAQLSHDFTFEPDLTYFLQVQLVVEEGICRATPLAGGGSGDHSNLAEVSAFLELPQGRSIFKAGESFPLIRFR